MKKIQKNTSVVKKRKKMDHFNKIEKNQIPTFAGQHVFIEYINK